MGAAISAANEQARAQQKETQLRMQAELASLTEILTNKRDLYISELVNSKGEDKTVPVKTFIEVKKHMSVDVSSGPSKNLTEGIKELFGGDFLSSLKSIALTAVNTVLGNAQAGSKEESGYKVVLLYNTVVRLDYFVYGYTMSSTGIADEKRNGLVMVCTVGVVDMKNVGLEVLVYLTGQQASTSIIFLEDRRQMWKGRRAKLERYSEENKRDFNLWTEWQKSEVFTWKRDMAIEIGEKKAELEASQSGASGKKPAAAPTQPPPTQPPPTQPTQPTQPPPTQPAAANTDPAETEYNSVVTKIAAVNTSLPPIAQKVPLPLKVPTVQDITDLISDIDLLDQSYNDLAKKVSDEQEAIFAQMTRVYQRAKGVVEVLKSI